MAAEKQPTTQADQEAEEERLYQLKKAEAARKALDGPTQQVDLEAIAEAERLAQEAEEERLYQLKKAEAARKAMEGAEHLVKQQAAQVEAERLAQEAEEERLYQLKKSEQEQRWQAQKTAVSMKPSAKPAPAMPEKRAAESTAAPAKKKKSPLGFVIGVVVAIAIGVGTTGFGLIFNKIGGLFDNGSAAQAPIVAEKTATSIPVVVDPATQAQAAANTATQAPVVIQNTATQAPVFVANTATAEPPSLRLQKNTYCRVFPSAEAGDVTAFLTGDSFPIIAQDADGWWLVKINIPQISRRKACWIYGEGHTLSGNYSTAPYMNDFEVGPDYSPP